MNRVAEIAWAAGIIEGEGCINIHKQKRMKNPMIRVAVSMTDEDVVRKLVNLFRIGSMAGPYQRGEGRKPQWRWTAAGGGAASILMTIFSFLGERRKQKAILALKTWRATPGRLELRTHCSRGHAYTPENLAHWASYYGRVCKECLKVYKQRRMAKVAAVCLLMTAIGLSGCAAYMPSPENQLSASIMANSLQRAADQAQNVGRVYSPEAPNFGGFGTMTPYTTTTCVRGTCTTY